MESKKIDLNIWQKIAQHPRLGEMLLQQKKINIKQLSQALETQKERENTPVGQVLVDLGYITEDEIMEVLKLQSKIGSILSDSIDELKKLKGE